MGGEEDGGEGREGSGRTRAAGREAQEGEKCCPQEGTLRSDEGEMGQGEEGGEVEAVEFLILKGTMLFGGVAPFSLGRGKLTKSMPPFLLSPPLYETTCAG